jgi:hypothetical protein
MSLGLHKMKHPELIQTGNAYDIAPYNPLDLRLLTEYVAAVHAEVCKPIAINPMQPIGG